MQNLADSTVYVVGGGSGKGLALAERIAVQGARIGLAGTSAAKLERATAQIQRVGGIVCTAVLDVRDEGAWESAMSRLAQELGPPVIDAHVTACR